MKTYLIAACLCVQSCVTLPAFAGGHPASPQNSAESARLFDNANERLHQASSRKDYEDAAGMLEQAVKLDPNNFQARQTLGWVYLDKLHQPHEAYSQLAVAAKGQPNDLNDQKLLGMACAQTGRERQAVDAFQRAERLDPNDLWIQASLGKALARCRQFREADQAYAAVLAKDPANFDARLGKAELAAWRGQTAESLKMLDQLIAENPTNVDALVLRGDVRRWDWQPSGAITDYEQATNVVPGYYAAVAGIKNTERAEDSSVTVKGYEFQDDTEFRRLSGEVDARVHVADKAYVLASGAYWHFENPGFDSVNRVDGAAGMEYDFNREVQVTGQGQVFDYEHQNTFVGGSLALNLVPVPWWTIYTVASYHQPFVSSMPTVTNSMRQEVIGNGMDVKLGHGFSIQNSFQGARLSDGNHWWEEKPQVSYQIFDLPATFIRAQYDHLSYSHANDLYYSPHDFNSAGPVLDSSLPLGKMAHFDVDLQAPWVFDAHKFGLVAQGGPTIDITRWAQLGASVIYGSIPGERGAPAGETVRPPWSGLGGQVFLRIWF